MTTLRSLIIKHRDYANSLLSEIDRKRVGEILKTPFPLSFSSSTDLIIVDYGPLGVVVESKGHVLYCLGRKWSEIEHVIDMVIDMEHFYDDPLPADLNKPASEQIVIKRIFNNLNMLI